jgi:hypothetical protein
MQREINVELVQNRVKDIPFPNREFDETQSRNISASLPHANSL